MPYITEENKRDLEERLSNIKGPENPGELNYLISIMCKSYIEDNGGRYQQHNDVMGALSCSQLEIYRRMTAPYEDIKIKENGDVF